MRKLRATVLQQEGQGHTHPLLSLHNTSVVAGNYLKVLKHNSSFLQQWKKYIFPLWPSQHRKGMTENQKLILKLNKGEGNKMEVWRGQNSEWRTLQILCWMTLQTGISLNTSEDFNTASSVPCAVLTESITNTTLPSSLPKKEPISVSSKFSFFPQRSQTGGND